LIIELTTEELNKCREAGLARTSENEGTQDIASYDHKRFDLTSAQANCLGVVAEYAVVKSLGHSFESDVWHPFVKRADYHLLKGPDVCGRYEVRRQHRFGNPLAIRQKDVEAGAVVVSVHVPFVRVSPTGIKPLGRAQIIGCIDAETGWDLGDVPSWSYKQRDRVVPMELLLPWEMSEAA